MAYGYYKTNKEVINFSCKNEIHKIVFNHYVQRKVNYQKLKGDLPPNQFKITLKTAGEDMSLSKSTIGRLLKEFESLEIITPIKKGSSSSSYSVYEYILQPKDKIVQNSETVSDKVYETVDGMMEVSDFKELGDCSQMVYDEVRDKVCEKSKIENLNNNIYSRVVKYLNEKSGKRFRADSKKTKASILARLNDNFVEEDFYKVIDIKCGQWLDTDMDKFIRPETLFSNKFESYLNERGKSKDVRVDDDIAYLDEYEIVYNF